MNALEAVTIGANILSGWVGQGAVPLPVAHAQARSDVCVKTPCQHHAKGKWWQWIARDVVSLVMAQRRARFEAGIMLEDEGALQFCAVCRCPLQNKVFVPMKHIESHTPPEVWEQLPDFCWMKKERGK